MSAPLITMVFLAMVLLANSSAAQKSSYVPPEVQQMLDNPGAYPTPNAEQLREIMPKIEQTVLQIFKIEPGTKEAEYVKEVVLNKNIPEKPLAPGTGNPLKHYVFKEGVELPSKDRLEQERQKIQLAMAEIIAGRKKEALEPRPETPPYKFQPSPVIDKPLCEVSATATLDIPKNYIAQGLPLDLLFVQGKLPFDVKTAIGAKTVVVPFGEADSAEIVSIYGSLNIDCVPFRLRSNGDKVTYSKGALALKNYDANPNSDGTFDPTVKKYIEQNNLGG